LALLWTLILFLGLECYHAFRWHAIQRSNPLVLERGDAVMWTSGEDIEGSPPPRDALPTPPAFADRLTVQSRRLSVFEGLTDLERRMFADSYGVRVVVADASANLRSVYARGWSTDAPAELKEIVGAYTDIIVRRNLAQAIESGRPEILARDAQSVGGEADSVLIYPLHDGETAAVLVAEPAGPGATTSERLVWEAPFFVYKPCVSREGKDFWTNNVGFRDDDVVLPKPPGVFRVVCIGGSTTEEGPTHADTYPNLLERRLRESFETESIEVINCGIAGMSVFKEWLRLPDFLALDPDLLVAYNAVNDLCHGVFPVYLNEATPLRRLVRRSAALNDYLNAWLVPLEDVTRLTKTTTLAHMAAIANAAQQSGVGMVLCSFAVPAKTGLSRAERDYFEYTFMRDWGGRYVTFATYRRALDQLNREIKKLCDEVGAVYAPVAERLSGGSECFDDICHMTNAGIERKAEIVFESIRDIVADRIGATPRTTEATE